MPSWQEPKDVPSLGQSEVRSDTVPVIALRRPMASRIYVYLSGLLRLCEKRLFGTEKDPR